MAVERTLSICKPDTVEKHKVGEVVAQLEASGLRPVAMQMMHLTRAQAEGFYYVHRERKFFGELVEFMTRGPVVVIVLQGENAIARYREVMGATDPAKAAEGTLRKKFGANVGENAVHGSDAPETAAFEIGYFFAGMNLPR
jgi:nucleoside-diphosphate kinase